MRLFYMLWQKKAVKVAKEYHKEIKFDLVQHVTFVSYTQPTYMYKLGIPMIWGPVSGGENIPSCISIKMSKKEKIVEYIRKLSQNFVLTMPCIVNTMKRSCNILVTTEETKNKIPKKYQSKTNIVPAIGLEKIHNMKYQKKEDNKVRIIMAGRLIYWKAFDIGIKAFLRIVDKYPNIELHILGEGDKKQELKTLSGKYLNDKIFFEEPVEHDKIYDFYKDFDIFLNTTLRDSGCMAMMEAMSVGLPCICIDTGGPKILSENMEFSKVKVDVNDNVIMEIALKLERLITDKSFRENLSKLSIEQSGKFVLNEKIKLLNEIYYNANAERENILCKVE